MVVATHTINRNDRNALSNIALEAKHNIQASEFTMLADKGYNNAKEIEACQNEGITTIVAQQEIVNSNEKGTTKDYLAINLFTIKKVIPTPVRKAKRLKPQALSTQKKGAAVRTNLKNTEPPLAEPVRLNICVPPRPMVEEK